LYEFPQPQTFGRNVI